MMRLHCLTFAALLAAAAGPAHAALTTITYTGSVSELDAPLFGPDKKQDVFLNSTVSFSVTYDPANLVYATKTRFKDANGASIVLHPALSTLYDVPGAAYSVTVGSHVWTLADDDYHGYINRNGVGPFPFAAYDGSPTTFVGLAADAYNADGLEFFSSPGDYLLGYDDAPAYAYDADGNQLFAVSVFDATLDAIRARALVDGRVPEPEPIALLMIGCLGMAVFVRRRGAARPANAIRPA